jgi:quinol monooxygenase YgiN
VSFKSKTITKGKLYMKLIPIKMDRVAVLVGVLFAIGALNLNRAEAGHTKHHAKKSDAKNRVGLLVRLEAKPGKEAAVEEFLKGGLAVVLKEPATTTWFSIRMGQSTFWIFDTFPNDAGRQAHLAGKVAAALMEKTPELLSQPPSIEKVDVLALKLP